MRKKREIARVQCHALDAKNAEILFATVDETGHTNAETAKKQRARRRRFGNAVAVDPLSTDDPSGSNIERVIAITAVSFVAIFFVLVIASQVAIGVIRRNSTANLATEVSVKAVGSAMSGGVEWGNGFTQFPERFSVEEADENTHRIEVTVTDTTSKDLLEVFAGSQIQAAALSINSLLNPNINTVIYHVQVYFNEDNKLQHSNLFGILPPQGAPRTLMTFIWTKTTTDNGVRFHCTIKGVDKEIADKLRAHITSSFTPNTIIGQVFGTVDQDVTDTTKDKSSQDGVSGKSAEDHAGSPQSSTDDTKNKKDSSATTKDSSNSTSSSQESDKDASEGSSVAVDNSNSVASTR